MNNDGKRTSPAQKIFPYILFTIILLGLYASSIYSFLLFHSLIEMFCVVVTLSVFILAWNSRRLLENHYLLFLGISFISSAAFELVHALAFKGFGVFPGNDANLPTQLWILFRYVFSVSLLVAPVFITRRINATVTLMSFAFITTLLFIAVFSGVFPDCFVEGKGLTPFKVISEYIIIVILSAAFGLLFRKRALFDPQVIRLLGFSIICAVAAEAAFTRYISVFDRANLVGHFFLFFSAVLICRAIIVTGIEKPTAILFRNLEQSEERFRQIAETSLDLIFQLDVIGKVTFCSPSVLQYGYKVEDLLGTDFRTYVAGDDLELATSILERTMGGEKINGVELRLLMADGTPVHMEINTAPTTVSGTVVGLHGISRDITARKQDQEVLRYQSKLLEKISDAIISTDLSFRITSWNTAAEKLFGWTAGETIGKDLDDLLCTEYLDSSRAELMKDLLGRDFIEIEVRHRDRLDRQLFVHGSLILLRNFSGEATGALMVFRDITARTSDEAKLRTLADQIQTANTALSISRIAALNLMQDAVEARNIAEKTSEDLRREMAEHKQSAQELRASENRYRGLAESIPAMLWAADVQGFTLDHNNRWYEYTGQTAEQAWGDGWKKIVHPDDIRRVEDSWGHAIKTGENYLIEYRIRRSSDGSYRWHSVQAMLLKDESGESLGWFGACIDIEDRKRAEQAAQAERLLLETVVNQLPAGICVIRGSDLKIQMVNPAYQSIAPGKEMVGKTLDELWPETRRTFADFCLHVCSTGEPHHAVDELNMISRIPGGQLEPAYFTWSLFRVGLPGEEGWAILNTAWETTGRVLAEEQIKASLAEKEVLLREIHHRVKNNLQVISSLVSLQADSLDDQGMRMALADVRDRVRAMALVHEKLYQTGNLALLNFADYAAGLLQYLWRAHGALAERVRLQMEIAPVAVPIEAAVSCGLILNELAGNALKHAFPDGHRGTMTAGLDQVPGSETLCLWVRDNGVGLPVGLDWRQSRSLGLRLVQLLTGQLHGTVETVPGPGTEFRITFSLNKGQS